MSFELQMLLNDLNPDKLYPLLSLGKEVDAISYFKDFGERIKGRQDKKQYPREFEKPLGVQLELTDRCNQKCIHCYNCSGEGRLSKGEMSIKQWRKVAHELSEMGVFQVIISGGEPLLLGDDLYEIMDILSTSKMRFIFISNGMKFDEKVMKRFIKSRYNFSFIQISIDGSRSEVHDIVRGVKGSWEKAVRAAMLVSDAGKPLNIAHCLVKQNVKLVEEMIDFAYILGASRIITGKVILSGRAIRNYDKIIMDKKDEMQSWEIVKRKIKEYFPMMQILWASDTLIQALLYSIIPSQAIVIRPNGDVKIGCDTPIKIGNVLKQSIMEIWETKGKNAWRNPIVQEYVKSLSASSVREPYLEVKPRPYIDEDIRL